ncbi:MAG TPA: hypothetical protein VN914_02835 [Polyangia bacterium]|nr:hypothetical protein [Polyangia bacterium]
MGPPWWVWVVGVVVAVVVGLARAAARWRRLLLDELLGHVRRLRPDVEILRHDSGALGNAWVAVKMPSGAEVTIGLQQLLAEISHGPNRTPEGRAPIMERWVKAIDETGNG